MLCQTPTIIVSYSIAGDSREEVGMYVFDNEGNADIKWKHPSKIRWLGNHLINIRISKSIILFTYAFLVTMFLSVKLFSSMRNKKKFPPEEISFFSLFLISDL